MELSELEDVLGYSFKNKKLLEEALTHPSYKNSNNNNPLSYNRLEFLGDAVIDLAISKYFFDTYPGLNEGKLTELRAANVSTEKFAHVAVRHGLYQFVRHNCLDLDQRVKEFEDSVNKEEGLVLYGGLVQAEDILADIVESVAAAIYIDTNSDLDGLWKIISKLLDPIFTLEDVNQNPHPVSRLQDICNKNKQTLVFSNKPDGSMSTVVVLIGDRLVASASANKQDVAKLNAARRALEELPEDMKANTETIDPLDTISESLGTEDAKQTLQDICQKKGWSLPEYPKYEERGPEHDKRFVCAVKVKDVPYEILGEERPKLKEAEKSAALSMIHVLKEEKKKKKENVECSCSI